MMQAQVTDLRKKVADLKKSKDAIILAHNYQIPEVQDVADYVGDSLGLARKAANTENKRIVFCGVHFMAETASMEYLQVPGSGKSTLLSRSVKVPKLQSVCGCGTRNCRSIPEIIGPRYTCSKTTGNSKRASFRREDHFRIRRIDEW